MAERGWRQLIAPKMTDTLTAQVGAGTQAFASSILDMRDSSSYLLVVENEHPTLTAEVHLFWWLDPDRIVLFREFALEVPAASDSIRVQGPTWAPYLSVSTNVPQQGGATTDCNVYVFGQNLDLHEDEIRVDSEASIINTSQPIDRVAIYDPDTPAAGAASVLASDPALTDSGLVTRAFLVGESPLGGGDTATVRTDSPVDGNAGLVTFPFRETFPGRTDWGAHGIAANIAAEALFTSDIYDGPTYTGLSASSYAIAAGRTLRIESFNVFYIGAVNTFGIVRLRVTNLAGNVIREVRVYANQAAGAEHIPAIFPGGLEIVGAFTLAFTRQVSAAAATNVLGFELHGFEYDTL